MTDEPVDDRAGVAAAADTAAQRASTAAIAVAVAAIAQVAVAVLLAKSLAAIQAEGTAGAPSRSLADRLSNTAMFVSGCLWLSWFKPVHRAVDRAGRLRHGGDWWFWGWVIPVVAEFRPKQMVNDVWRAADGPGEFSAPPWQMQAWWALWVGATVARVAGAVADVGDYGPGTASADVAGELASALLIAASAPFAIWTIRHLTARVARLRLLDQAPAHSAGVEPPSTGTTQPVTYDAAGDSRNAATRPNSAGSP